MQDRYSGDREGGLRLTLRHAGGALLAGVAVFFMVWFLVLNPYLPRLFSQLMGSWVWGNARMDWAGLGWGVTAVAFCGVVGWFTLECFELYLPRLAAAALAYILGLGLVGFVLECLAIPHRLERGPIALGLGFLLGLLAAGAWRGARRPTESGLGGEAGPDEQRLRRRLARQAHERAVQRPRSLGERVFRSLCVALIVGITFFNFWHALLYPEVYWDSMILYLGYARMTFLEHGFPVKITGQVGIGLGANYPHLYSVLGAGVASARGAWSELPQQLMAPLCGVATTVLVYHTALRLTRHVNAAMAIALLYRSIPLAITYDQYASDYALAMLFAAAFLYLALRAIESGLLSYLTAAALLIGLAMHLNYLMGILWAPWAVAVWTAQVGWSETTPLPAGADSDASWTGRPERLGWRGLLGGRWLWLTLLVTGALGATWYVRNWIVTGNPVYAFFYDSLFPGSKFVNPAVMEASAREWLANGAGIGRLGQTVAERLRALPVFLAGAPGWHQGYRLMPIVAAFSLGGLLVWLGRWLASPATGSGRSPAERAAVRFGLVVTTLAGGLLAFHIVLAPFYLYQVIKLLPCLALLAALAWPLWRGRPWRWVFGALALWTGLVPGLAMALMGTKIGGLVHAPGGDVSPLSLFVLRHPLPEPGIFYRWRYGDDALMWDTINRSLKGQPLLTHENRHLAFDPSIRIVHLDDWDMQALWRIPDPAERVGRLVRDFGIQYYLYVPNEDNTSSNALMGAKDWPNLGLAQLVYETMDPPNRLYRLMPPVASPKSAVSRPSAEFPAEATAPTTGTSPAR